MSQKTRKQLSLAFTLVVILFMGLLIWRQQASAGEQDATIISYSTDTVRALVTAIVEEGTTQLGEIEQTYQVVQVQVLEGEQEGLVLTVEHGRYQIIPRGSMLQPGQRILITLSPMPDGSLRAFFIDYVRTVPLLVLFAVFVVMSILISGWKGFQSMLGIAVSLVIIFYFVIPRIMAGQNPILVSIAGSFLFLSVTQFLIYGWTLKTHIANVAIVLAMSITGVLAVVFTSYARLSGFGDESTMFLVQQMGNLNTQNLLIAGILIGTLGVLDDLVIGQASMVIELHKANPSFSFQQRFASALKVGRDHIAATVNTLVLAYLGAALSMFLLFSLNNPNILLLLNINFIAEEIVRSLVGTLGLFMAVPVTTLLACWAVDKPERISALCRWLGPLTDDNL